MIFIHTGMYQLSDLTDIASGDKILIPCLGSFDAHLK